MKKLFYSIFAFSTLMFASCSDDNPTWNLDTGGDDNTENVDSYHVDVWTTVEGTQADGDYVLSVYNPSSYDGGTLSVKGSGTEVTDIVTSGMFANGKYYYGGNLAETGYGKYQVLKNETINISAQIPFQGYTYSYGGMTGSIAVTHAWLDENTLICSQYSKDNKKHYWTKLDASGSSLRVVAEGEFDLHAEFNSKSGNTPLDAADYNYYPQVDADGNEITDIETNPAFNHEVYDFSVSGHMRYRKSDNTIVFVTTPKFKGAGKSGMGGEIVNRGPLAVIVLDAKDMSIKSSSVCDAVNGLALESYGDTCQERAMIDEETGDFYVIALAKEARGYYPPGKVTPSRSVIVRVKSGEGKVDTSFGTNGALYPYGTSDLTVIAQLQYLGSDKAMVFMGKASDITANKDFSHHYAILDLKTGTFSDVEYDGKVFPKCQTGSFSNFMAKGGSKIFFAVTAESATAGNGGTEIYTYDLNTKAVEFAFEVEKGVGFSAIRIVENN